MSVPVTELKQSVKAQMTKAEEAMRHDFAAVRTGKASPSLVENIVVEYYGTPTRLRDLANIAAPEPRLLTVQPWDTKVVGAIEKALIAANLGMMPVSDGRILRLPVPELSQERRQSLVKQIKARSEDAKVAVRNIRRDANDVAKKAQKAGEITEDDLKRLLDDLQTATDNCIANIDKITAEKDRELMTV